MGGAKIGVIALHIHSGQTGDDDRRKQRAAGSLFKRSGHLLDGKNNSRQRRVEGRRHPRDAAGNNQAAFHEMARKTNQPTQAVQQCRANLDSGSFTAYAGTARKPNQGQQLLPKARRIDSTLSRSLPSGMRIAAMV